MRHACTFLTLLTLCLAGWGAAPAALADDTDAAEADAVEGMEPVMVSLNERDAPSEEEWESLHEETQRAGFFGGLSDLKSQTVSFMDTEYFTTNRAEGTLASYGKMDGKDRFDRYGHIAHVEFDVAQNSWKEHYAVNAAALVQLTGQARFAEFAGVELDTAVRDRRQIEVTFIGTMLPKDEAIRRLNADVDALEYLGSLHEKRARYDKKSIKLLAGSAPPKPRIVLANVVMLDGKSSQEFEGSLGGKAKSVIHGVGGGLKVVKSGGEEVSLLTPVVRCYRTYSIEFKTNDDGALVRVPIKDQQGRRRQVPVVFDLTPDL